MEITKTLNNNVLTLTPHARVDTQTAPELEEAVIYDGVSEIVFDFSEVDYISSAGLRVLVRAKKRLNGGKVVVAHAAPVVREVFDVVGFSDAFEFV